MNFGRPGTYISVTSAHGTEGRSAFQVQLAVIKLTHHKNMGEARIPWKINVLEE